MEVRTYIYTVYVLYSVYNATDVPADFLFQFAS